MRLINLTQLEAIRDAAEKLVTTLPGINHSGGMWDVIRALLKTDKEQGQKAEKINRENYPTRQDQLEAWNEAKERLKALEAEKSPSSVPSDPEQLESESEISRLKTLHCQDHEKIKALIDERDHLRRALEAACLKLWEPGSNTVKQWCDYFLANTTIL